jgi:hypothetical protein
LNSEFVYPGSEPEVETETASDEYTVEEAIEILTKENNGQKPRHLTVLAWIKNNKKPQ